MHFCGWVRPLWAYTCVSSQLYAPDGCVMRRQASAGSGGYCSALAASQRRRQSQRRQPPCQLRLVPARQQAAKGAAGRVVGRLGRRRLTGAPLSMPRRDGSCWLRRPLRMKPSCLLRSLAVQRSARMPSRLPCNLLFRKSRLPERWRLLQRRPERQGRRDARSRRRSMLMLLRTRVTAAIASAPVWALAH